LTSFEKPEYLRVHSGIQKKKKKHNLLACFSAYTLISTYCDSMTKQ
jgi:hypothetical protein